MSDCIFCKILEKSIPSYQVYEDEYTLAFLDIFPCVQGHTVVIPKVHAHDLLDFEKQTLQGFFLGVQKSLQKVQQVLAPQGFTVGWNHGAAGHQAVPHLHVHILPRFENDGGGSMHSVVKNPSMLKVEEVAKLFESKTRENF